MHQTLERIARWLAPGLLPVLLLGCGPRVFAGETAKLIEVERPPPPPPVTATSKPEARVEITDDKIVIREKIQFDRNQATIKRESDDLLAEIARVINENPRIHKIRIEGHASADGRYKHNVELSKRRAKAVREHLVKRGGVDPARLESEGYGPDQPIADNETPEGREANRRVEFTIVSQDYTQTKTSVDPQTGRTRVAKEQKSE
jgi:OOP family OmpA-OmpF porin